MEEAFGRPMTTEGQGGSIPLCNVLAKTYPDAEIILLGVEEPKCLIHAPNESVHPSEIEHTALAEALFLRKYANRRVAVDKEAQWPSAQPPPVHRRGLRGGWPARPAGRGGRAQRHPGRARAPTWSYLTGYAPVAITERLTLLVIPVDRDPVMIVPILERPDAEGSPERRLALIDWADGTDPYAAAGTARPGRHYAISDSAWAMHLLGLKQRCPAPATPR